MKQLDEHKPQLQYDIIQTTFWSADDKKKTLVLFIGCYITLGRAPKVVEVR